MTALRPNPLRALTDRVPAGRRRPALAAAAVLVTLAVAVPVGLATQARTGSSGSDASTASSSASGVPSGTVRESAPDAVPAPDVPRAAAVDGTTTSGSGTPGGATGLDAVDVGPVLARSAWLGVRVADLVAASDRARAVAREVRGDVVFENVVTATDPTGGYGAVSGPQVGAPSGTPEGAPDTSMPVAPPPVGVEEARMTLSVPAATLDRVLTSLSRLGTVSYRSSQSEDVTSSYVDAKARIQPARDGIARVRALLAKATDLQQVVLLENELSRRQADLDSLTSRLADLEQRTTMSDVTLTLWTAATEPAAATTGGLTGTLRDAWQALLSSVGVIVTGLAVLLPWLLLVGLAALVTVRVRRRRAPASTPPAARPAD